MTEDQKNWIRETQRRIMQEPAGINYKIYISITIARIQHTKINNQYRMMSIENHTTKEQIIGTMMKAFRDMESKINTGGV